MSRHCLISWRYKDEQVKIFQDQGSRTAGRYEQIREAVRAAGAFSACGEPADAKGEKT